MIFHDKTALVASALLCFYPMNSVAQTPAAAPAAVPADVSPLYVVTCVEAKPTAKDEAPTLLKSYRDASRTTAGNLRSVQMAAAGTKEFRDKLAGTTGALYDERLYEILN